MKRRKFVVAVAAGTVIPSAGCSDGGASDVDIATSSPEVVVESYHEVLDQFDRDSSVEEILDAVEPAFHSASPLPALIRESETEDRSAGLTHTLTSVEAEVIDENLGADRLHQEFGLLVDRVDQEDIDAITEENAIVEADIDHEEAPDGTVRHLTALEDGDWLVVV